MPHSDTRRITSGSPAQPFKVLAPIVAVTLCFCAICAYVLIEARRAAWDYAGDTAASLATAVESDLVRNIDTLNLSLNSVIDNLKQPEIGKISRELLQVVLFDRAGAARHLGAIMVIDATGVLRLDSRTLSPQPLDLSDRDYFQAHKNNQSSVLYIGSPQRSGAKAQALVGISRRLSRPDGSFNGVVAGSLRLGYLQRLFQEISLGPDTEITLSRTNGTILMRWPYDETVIGRDLGNAELIKRVAQSRSGRFDRAAAPDGVDRLLVYRQVGDLPIVLSIGQSTHDVFAQWRRYAWVIGLLTAALCVMSGTLATFLLRELKRRNIAERELATLASIDGLTGLSNRRHFDETIHREWRRGLREQTPLALLMIDTDLFKAYNDSHGHQAGDLLLKTIGGAIAVSIRRGIDLGARYGGDEFAVLLPATSLGGAARVADQIREQFITDCRTRGASDDARISVGVACLMPDAATDPSALLAAADGALYRAKNGGRNRTELAEPESVQPPEAAALQAA